MILVDNPVIYKFFPGFDATPEPLILLERLRRGLDNDLDRRPLPGEPELRGETGLESELLTESTQKN